MAPLRRDQTSVAALESALADAEHQLAAAEVQRDRLAAGLSEAIESVVVVDQDGTEVFRNAGAERFRNARHVDAIVETAMAELLDQARAGEVCELPLSLHGPPRTVLHLRAFPLFDGATPLGAAVLVHDVSEIHRVESVRRDFVANVSHELKTPIGALGLLAETLAAETKPQVIHPLAERIVQEAERLGRIVDDLLDLSLIETQEAPSRTPVSVREIVDEAVDHLRPAAMVAGIELRVRHGAGAAVFSCSRRQVVSAVSNLLDNAVKYSESGGTVEIKTEMRGGQLVISVRDSGIGVPTRDHERIFERFYRVDHARSRDTGGTGLGLSIVRHVAQAHGGDVTVESIEGQGSTFRLVLGDDIDAFSFPPVPPQASTTTAPSHHEGEHVS
ncbi:MAG TPA: ATP-binding protein [Acidimicrobiia bacterium]